MPKFDGTGDVARRGGLALQEKLRAQQAAAMRMNDYEAALRTIYMLSMSGLGTPEARLAHVRQFTRDVLAGQAVYTALDFYP